MHPLPRVGELDVAFDSDTPRRLFRAGRLRRADPHGADLAPARPQGQVAAPLRGRLRSTTSSTSTSSRAASASTAPIRIASCTIRWKRNTCATSSTSCSRRRRRARLRCVYCEREIEHFVVASKKNKWYAADPSGAAARSRPPQGRHPVRGRSRGAGRRLPFPPRGSGAPAGATRRRARPRCSADRCWTPCSTPSTGRLLAARRAFLFGYLCGSIPFGVILTRLAGTQDIRSVGSGNIGATNVLRTGRKALAAATLLGDMLKGTAAVLIALYFLQSQSRAGGRARRVPRSPVSGLAALQGRQGRRDLYRRPARPGVAGRPRLLRHLARGGGA